MKKRGAFVFVYFLSAITFLTSCTKSSDFNFANVQPNVTTVNGAGNSSKTKPFTSYVIEKGAHYCSGNYYPPFADTALYFTVVFDSSAIYHFTDPATLYDNNKLYGFADNNSFHQQFSARFGWRWFNNELQLAAYTYNKGVMSIVQLGKVDLGIENKCAIVVKGDHYNFVLNGITTSVPRASTTKEASGYKLYPYFGGDATAPHKITILLRDDN